MEREITIDITICKKCKVCTEICPNRIFHQQSDITSVRAERIFLCVMCGQCMAACPCKAIKVAGLDYNEDFFALPETSDSFNSLIHSRRSVRVFKDIPVPKELLEQIVDAITFSPPSFPPVNTEIIVIMDKGLIKESLPHMISLYDKLLKGLKNPVIKHIIRSKIGKEKFRVIQNHIVPMFNIKLPFMKNGSEDAITRNAQAMILFHANRKSDNYATDIYIALVYAILKAHSLGVGATIIDLIPPAIDKTPFLRKMFKIPEENEVVASIILGFPKFRYYRAIKRRLKSLTWIQ